jgi:hypothetical protein
MFKRAPFWLKAEKGKPIRVIPERTNIVKKIFQWSFQGIDQYLIADRLNAEGVPSWSKKNTLDHWRAGYVSEILRNRAVIGEYQPHKKRIAKIKPMSRFQEFQLRDR